MPAAFAMEKAFHSTSLALPRTIRRLAVMHGSCFEGSEARESVVAEEQGGGGAIAWRR